MNFIQKWILKRLVAIPLPNTIPRSGDAAKSVNCFAIYFKAKDKDWTFLLTNVVENGIVGKHWIGRGDSVAACIPFTLLKDIDIEINHFYGVYNLEYNSIAQYIMQGFIPVDKSKILMGRVDQFLFNRKRLVRSDRIDTLKLVFEKTIDNPNFEFSHISLIGLLHTNKWVFHPDKDSQLRHMKLLLDSLVVSKDLQTTSNGYKLASHALITISEYEEEQNKHNQNLDQSKSMKWLTLALMTVGLIQAAVAYFKA